MDLTKLLDMGGFGLAFLLALALFEVIRHKLPTMREERSKVAHTFSAIGEAVVSIKSAMKELKGTMSEITNQFCKLREDVQELHGWHAPNDEGVQPWRRPTTDVNARLDRIEEKINKLSRDS